MVMSANYNKSTGYAERDNVIANKIRVKLEFIRRILDQYGVHYNAPILVAGCGDGQEAVIMGDVFQRRTIGVDLFLPHKAKGSKYCELYRGDLSQLSFPDNTFSFIYSFHVLEHVDDHHQVLRELRRLLMPDRHMFIGFPNRNRLIAYVDSHNDVPLKDKILWNLNDYKRRLAGTFENSLGAHAGFSENSFIHDAQQYFNEVRPIRNDYMLHKYPRYVPMIKLLITTGLNEIVFPSNYYLCRK